MKNFEDILELYVTYAPDVPPQWQGRRYLFHANNHMIRHWNKYRIVQMYYYNVCPVRFITVTRKPVDYVWVEVLDYPKEPVRLWLDPAAGKALAYMQRKMAINDYTKHDWMFGVRATPDAGWRERGPTLLFEPIERLENVLIECCDAPDDIALIPLDSAWYKYKDLARKLKYDIVPAMGRAPSWPEYRKLFIEEATIEGVAARRLFDTRAEAGLP